MSNIIGFTLSFLSIGAGIVGFWSISKFGPIGHLLEKESWEIASLPLAMGVLIVGGFHLMILLTKEPIGKIQTKIDEIK